MFTFTGCSHDSGGDDNNSGNNSGGGGNSSIVGNWTFNCYTLEFKHDNPLVIYHQEERVVANLTYTYSGTTLTVSMEWASDRGTATISSAGNALTLSNHEALSEGTYTRVQ